MPLMAGVISDFVLYVCICKIKRLFERKTRPLCFLFNLRCLLENKAKLRTLLGSLLTNMRRAVPSPPPISILQLALIIPHIPPIPTGREVTFLIPFPAVQSHLLERNQIEALYFPEHAAGAISQLSS